MSTSTQGATIFYTTDGSTPTHSGASATGSTLVYSGPIDIGTCGQRHFKALAYKSGYIDSTVSSLDTDHGDCGGGGMASMSAGPTFTSITYSVWDGDWALLEEYDKNNNLIQKYLQGYHGLVKTLVGTAVYYYQDELGSTSHIANSSGQLLEYYKYNLYGAPTYWSAANSQLQASNYQVADLGNGGARWMPELGLYDNRNRFMSPDLGRFLQPDPIGFKGDASNLYRYVGNNWSSRTDPMGLYEIIASYRGNDGTKVEISEELKKEIEAVQANVAASLEKVADKIDKGIEGYKSEGNKSKEVQSVQKMFEKYAGKGSGTVTNMVLKAGLARNAAAYLRDNGIKGCLGLGYKLFPVHAGKDSKFYGDGVPLGTTIRINVDKSFTDKLYSLKQTLMHESLHNAGLPYESIYKWDHPRYENMKSEERLINPDHVVELFEHL